MATALALRSQIEASLAQRIPSALTPQRRMIRPVVSTGIAAVDQSVGGGVPTGALTEMVGAECSGRTSLALSLVAEVMREGRVCAWVDVSDGLSPESAAAAGVDLTRLLWVRCGVVREPAQRYGNTRNVETVGFAVPERYFVAPPAKKGLHGGGFGMHPRDEERGMVEAVSGLLQRETMSPRYSEPQRGAKVERAAAGAAAVAVEVGRSRQERPGKGPPYRGEQCRCSYPWQRMEQALRATDLLLQTGGFGAIVLDMASVAPEHAARIPLATWFRYRAAAERTQACVVLLTQYACAKSSAELVLQMERGMIRTRGGAVLTAFDRRVEVVRRRFTTPAGKSAGNHKAETNVLAMRKPPQRSDMGTWQSRAVWAGAR